MSTVEIENYRWKCENFLKGYCPGKDCDVCAKITNRLLLKGLVKITHADEVLKPVQATPPTSQP
ncbi:hypothetical protein E6H19_01805 [Candidatus Bathyarchaeota archaeon]|jgi:hypothetical protein|nr:MAG: hypothetical protein AUF79_05325 [Crenarchaeota archaeon 13_1_20CM_2_51_8]TMI28333.1 MAG: hypothetical protein E6H30_01370 [Candidatus Bathyarchaeota archaeon]TMI46301.1 MAG: hypothetical protein E6H19_01805 [Candidatus Bathyarchaeota archaeon]